jgi:hypothetical protein
MIISGRSRVTDAGVESVTDYSLVELNYYLSDPTVPAGTVNSEILVECIFSCVVFRDVGDLFIS